MELKGRDDILLFVIGCPGAGKGTLCSRLARELGWAHISVGDELRKYVQNLETDNDISICVRENTLVPAETLAPIIKARKEALQAAEYRSFIVDGFPRSKDQIEVVANEIGRPNLVLNMKCPEDIAKTRVLNRNLAGRQDTEAVFEQRYAEFDAKNPPIVEYFMQDDLVETIDTSLETAISYSSLVKVLLDRDLALAL